MANQLIFALPRVTDANGDPVSGARVRFYETGTTTPVTVYSDTAMSVAHASPLVADSGGYFAQAFYGGATDVKAVVTTSADATLYTYDPCPMIVGASSGAENVTFSPVAGNAATDVQAAIENNTTALAAKISSTRTITAGTGLTGGGDLSANRTLSIDFKDEDNMASNSATHAATQQSIKAYVDTVTDSATYRTLLATKTASSSATLDFTEFVNATYRRYEFELENVKPATDGVSLHARTSTDSGATYDAGASDYNYAVTGYGGASATTATSNAAAQMVVNGGLLLGNAATEYGVSGVLSLYSPADAAVYTRLMGSLSYYNQAGSIITVQVAGSRLAQDDVTAMQFLMSGGNIASGTIRMYGVI